MCSISCCVTYINTSRVLFVCTWSLPSSSDTYALELSYIMRHTHSNPPQKKVRVYLNVANTRDHVNMRMVARANLCNIAFACLCYVLHAHYAARLFSARITNKLILCILTNHMGNCRSTSSSPLVFAQILLARSWLIVWWSPPALGSPRTKITRR